MLPLCFLLSSHEETEAGLQLTQQVRGSMPKTMDHQRELARQAGADDHRPPRSRLVSTARLSTMAATSQISSSRLDQA